MSELLERIQADQRERWARGERVAAEEYLRLHPELGHDEDTALDLICGEILLREERGEAPQAEEYAARFPHYAAALRSQMELHALLRAVATDEVAAALSHTGACADTQPTRPGSTNAAQPAAAPPAPDYLPDIPGYEVLGRLDAGGRGVVYKARQLSLNRVVALKVLRPDTEDTGPEALARMRHEARAAAEISHAHIVPVYDFGEFKGQPYFTMEYVEGGSLKGRLAGGPLPTEEAVRLVEKLARALELVHARGIVHRDLKPGNVLLTAAGEPKVADFGLAKRLDGEASLNPSGALVGTLLYMAPEQAAGKSRAVGPPADVWALGAILYEAVTGRRPFPFTDVVDTLHRIRQQDPQPPRRLRPGLPRDVETICLKCLEKDPAKRYAGARELADDCAALLANRPLKARPRSWYARGWRWAKRHPVVLALGAVAALAAAAVPLALNHFDPNRPRREAEATLAARRPLVLRGDEPLPGPLRWVYGGAGPPRHLPNEKGFALETTGLGLLEVVADPETDHYRFSARVRHDRASGQATVGIYFGYRERVNGLGLRRLSYYTLKFAERGPDTWKERDKDGAVLGYVVLNGGWLVERPNLHPSAGQVIFPGGKRFPRAPLDRPGPWRRIMVEVTPDRVQAFWENAPGDVEKVTEVSAGLVRANFLEHMRGNGELAVLGPDYSPRGGLGLYINEGKALFRDVVVEPLPAGK